MTLCYKCQEEKKNSLRRWQGDFICLECVFEEITLSVYSNSPFPDCSICKKQADDGGWLDFKNYRFWVCIDCDDWLDEIERKKEHR